jgi:hypothetical protein
MLPTGAKFQVTSLALCLVFANGCARRDRTPTLTEPQKPNGVVLYLEGAERQCETDDQRQEILRALEDLRTLDAGTLTKRRYADYQNVPGRWTLAQLLQKYFVPCEPRSIEERTLYRDAQEPAAREVVAQQLRAIREGRPVVCKP